jgi:hypothetical protein
MFTCTKDHPWSPKEETPAEHPDAVEVDCQDGYPGGDIVTYRCPHCGKAFKCELPQ